MGETHLLDDVDGALPTVRVPRPRPAASDSRVDRDDAAGPDHQGLLSEVARQMDRMLAHHTTGWGGDPLAEAARHSLRGRGRMVRAEVFLAACQAVGGDPVTLVPAAAGIEFGHLAGVVHGGVVNEDGTSSPTPTVWRHCGRSTATLTGDWLLFAAVDALAASALPAERVARALRILARSGMETCLGTGLDLTLTGDVWVAPETYLRMARAKAGSPMGAVAATGALLGGGSDAQVAAARAYGECVGVARQIVDDLLLHTADPSAVSVHDGGSGLRPTLPVLYAMGDCEPSERHLLWSAFAPAAGSPPTALARAYGLLLGVLHRTGALHRARRVAEEHCAGALDALDVLPEGSGRDRLAGVAVSVLRAGR